MCSYRRMCRPCCAYVKCAHIAGRHMCVCCFFCYRVSRLCSVLVQHQSIAIWSTELHFTASVCPVDQEMRDMLPLCVCRVFLCLFYLPPGIDTALTHISNGCTKKEHIVEQYDAPLIANTDCLMLWYRV